MGKRILVIILVMVVAVVYAVATTSTLLPLIFHRDAPISRFERGLYQNNPAAMYYSDTISISSANVGYNCEDLSKALLVQEGTGFTEFNVAADSYYKFSPRVTVWGAAGFSTGSRHQVKWNNALDYWLLAPYILGDSVGGNLNHQRYSFSGGWSSLYGHWTVGVSAGYRAEIASRSHDPRVKDVVSDLNISAGVTRLLSRTCIIGLSLGVRIYSQESDVDFLNPMNDIQTYPLTGLGTYYNRFVGNATSSCGYSVTSYRGGLQLLTSDHSGFKLNTDYTGTRASEQMRDYNNITLGYTWTDDVTVAASYRLGISSRFTIEPELIVNAMARRGTEQLFGSVIGSSYDKIGERPNYSAKVMVLNVSVPVQYAVNEILMTAAPGFTTLSSSEKLIEPLVKKSFDFLTANLHLNARLMQRDWIFSFDISGCYGSRLSGGETGVRICRSTRVGVIGLTAAYGHATIKKFNTTNYFTTKIDLTF